MNFSQLHDAIQKLSGYTWMIDFMQFRARYYPREHMKYYVVEQFDRMRKNPVEWLCTRDSDLAEAFLKHAVEGLPKDEPEPVFEPFEERCCCMIQDDENDSDDECASESDE